MFLEFCLNQKHLNVIKPFSCLIYQKPMCPLQRSLNTTLGEDEYSSARKEVLTHMCSRPMQVRAQLSLLMDNIKNESKET